jgi:putative membrane protein
MADVTDSEPGADREALQAVATHRLHPMSWLFTLIAQLRMFALPILVLLLGGSRRDGDDIGDLIGLAGAGALAVVAVWQYFTYRYGFLEAALVIRSGLLQRNVRLIPFDRVQNVTLHQNLLHRLVGVAEVRLESAGGMGKAEAQMQVLKLEQANELEALVRAGARRARVAGTSSVDGAAVGAVDGDVEAGESTPTLWLHLPTRELVRLGLISNRGMLVVAAGFAYLSQAGETLTKRLSNGIEAMGREGIALAESWHLGPVAYAALAVALLVTMIVLVRLLSVSLAILHFHDFQLHAGERELRVERGLISRVRSHLPKRRIQAYSLRETLLHRWFGRQSLRVDRAAVEAVNQPQSTRDLVPLATPQGMESMIAALLPEGGWPLQDWQRLHPRAWWRVFVPSALIVLFGTALLVFFDGPQGLAALLALPLAFLRAGIWARYSAWTLAGGVIAFRQGCFDRHWRFAEVRKLQALRISQSPFDRRHGMATLHLDTAGASPSEPALRIPYLAVADAEALAARLRELMPKDAGINPARTAASEAPAA